MDSANLSFYVADGPRPQAILSDISGPVLASAGLKSRCPTELDASMA